MSTYDRMANRAAAAVIASYSTSFSLATRLLAEPVRTDITNLYAVVRIADELVDGAAADAGIPAAEIRSRLDEYEARVLAAAARPISTDPVLHAFGRSARRCHFREEHLRAFFASMRRDLDDQPHDQASLGRYVYGSAEVIGLLCLAAFVAPAAPSAELAECARALGAAFQKINFLRDAADDAARLGRGYVLTDRAAAVADIRADLDRARPGIAQLPDSSRTGVLVATNLFSALTDKLAATEQAAAGMAGPRVRLPAARKAMIVAASISQARRMK